jgi:RND family efflux transporter MFP subunit
MKATAGSFQPRMEVSGRVVSGSDARLAFLSAGRIERLYAREGQQVSAGQRLARLDTTELAAQEDQARAALDKAERDYERVRRLHGDEVSTEQQLKDARTALRRARAQHRRARWLLDKALLRAPFAGYIAEVHAAEQEIRGAGDPVLRLVASDPGLLKLRADIPARFLHSVRPGDTLEVRAPLAGVETRAVVLRVSGAARERTGTHALEAALPGAAGLHPGEVARLTLHGPARRAAALPAGALSAAEAGIARIFTVRGDTVAVLSEVPILGMRGDSVYVSPEEIAGRWIVTGGAGFLRDGERIVLTAKER